MAKVRKRGNSYQIDYVDPDGKRVRRSFKKRKEAEAELGKRVSLIAENRYLDVKKDYKSTLKELLEKYAENHKSQTSFENLKKYCIENFKQYFGEDILLSNIRYVDLETYRNKLRTKITIQGRVRADATVNREIGVLRHIFRKAVEWDMAEESPFDKGKSLHIKETNERLRYLTEEEIDRLLEESPLHLKRIVKCAINTGMRKGEILNLKWDQIKKVRVKDPETGEGKEIKVIYLEGQMTKTKEPGQIPINEDLEEVFKEIRREQGLSSKYVFTYYGRNITKVDKAFKGAVKRAGIVDFRFHDLRHTFASHFLMRGGTLKELQEILRHKSLSMTMRYSHLSQEHKWKAVNLLNGLSAPTTRSEKVCHKNVTSSNPAKTTTS
jgi:integrase